MVFVTIDKAETMQRFAELRPYSQVVDISGYQTTEIRDDTNCLHSVDIADQGLCS